MAIDPIDPAARTELNRRMEERRAELGLRWREVAEIAGGITVEGIRGVRVGPSSIPPVTRRKLERALQWPPDEIDRILDSSASTPSAQLTDEEMISMNGRQLARHYIKLVETIGPDEAEDRMVYILTVRRNARRSVAADST